MAYGFLAFVNLSVSSEEFAGQETTLAPLLFPNIYIQTRLRNSSFKYMRQPRIQEKRSIYIWPSSHVTYLRSI
jgi:hypothetical protein